MRFYQTIIFIGVFFSHFCMAESSCNNMTFKIINNSEYSYTTSTIEDGKSNIRCFDENTCIVESKGTLNNISSHQTISTGETISTQVNTRFGSRGDAWGSFFLHASNHTIEVDYKFESLFYGWGRCNPKIKTSVTGLPVSEVDVLISDSQPQQVLLTIRKS